MRYSPTERIGVTTIDSITTQQLGWIFREQPIVDMGVDAQIEYVDPEGQPTGKLLALQIKTGSSHLKPTADGYTYYGDRTHLDYWTGHSLPVLLVCHLPKAGQTFWQIVTKQTITLTDKKWKIFIPTKNIFGTQCKNQIADFFDGSIAQQKLRGLTLDLPLMRHIAKGRKVTVELERWYNKSLGRSPVEIFVYDDHGEEEVHSAWNVVHPYRSIEELAEFLFPWAGFTIDQDFYDINMDDYEDERERLMRAIDIDSGFTPYTPPEDEIYPYTDLAGEVEAYRLQLRLNDVGKSFLTLSSFLELDQEDLTIQS